MRRKLLSKPTQWTERRRRRRRVFRIAITASRGGVLTPNETILTPNKNLLTKLKQHILPLIRVCDSSNGPFGVQMCACVCDTVPPRSCARTGVKFQSK